MNVLIVNYEFPPLGGGAGNASRYNARELVRSFGHRVTVLTSAFRGLPRREVQDGFDIVRIPTRRRNQYRCTMFEMFVFAVSLSIIGFCKIARVRPDVLLIYNGMPCGHIGPLCRWFLGIPYVLFLRGCEVPGHRGEPKLMGRLLFPLTWLVWKQAAAVAANGVRLRDLAHKAIPSVKVAIVPNGVDVETFQPGTGAPRERGALRLIYTGRFSPEKGLPRVFEAVRLWLEKRPQAAATESAKPVITMIGDGLLMPKLRAMAAQLADKLEVRFPGWIDRTEIAEEFRRADVYVSGSYDEGVSNSILEAMASGLAIVASDIEGHRELVTDGVDGFLCKDAEMMAHALARLSEPAVLSRLKTAARTAAEQRSWTAATHELSDTIAEALI